MKFDFPLFILNIILTIVIYSLPIIIYRYAIKKQPLPEKKAKKVTIIYGIIAFIVMAVVSGAAPGAAIILWSTVNYNMLKKPSKHDVYVDNAIYSENCAITDTPRIDETVPQATETIIDEQKQEQSLIVEETIVDAPKSNELQKPIESTNNVSFCRKCGTRLTAKSEFCHKCGTRVLK